MLFITLVHAYNLSHEREISVGKLILMIILISSRIFRGLFTLLSERTEYHRPRQSPGRLPVAVASHGEFLVLLPWFPIHLLGLAGLHIFSKGRNETLGNGAQVVGCNRTIQQPIPPSHCRAQCKLCGRVISRLTDRLRLVRSLQLCQLSNRFWSFMPCDVQMILSAAADRCSRGTGGRYR